MAILWTGREFGVAEVDKVVVDHFSVCSRLIRELTSHGVNLDFTVQNAIFSWHQCDLLIPAYQFQGTLFARLMPQSSNTFCGPDVGAITTLKLPALPRKTSFRATVKREANKARKLCAAFPFFVRLHAALLRPRA